MRHMRSLHRFSVAGRHSYQAAELLATLRWEGGDGHPVILAVVQRSN
jgi:hypothetical protein